MQFLFQIKKYVEKFVIILVLKYFYRVVLMYLYCDEKSMSLYNELYEMYNRQNGGRIYRFITKHFIKISSCFIIGQENRAKYRKKMKKILHV